MSGEADPVYRTAARPERATIALLSAGSRGDTQPYVALGLALRRAGYRVRLAAAETFEAFVTHHGLDFHPVRGDVLRIATDPAQRKALRADTPLRAVASFRRLRDLAYDLQQDFYDACRGADAVVWHPGAAIGHFAAREAGVPSVLATPFPMTPTRAWPSLLFYDAPRFGPLANRLSHHLFERTMWLAAGGPIRRFWQDAFGRPPEAFGVPYRRQRSRRSPTVVGCSEHVFPKPDDWPEHVHMTGSWFLDPAPDWTPPAPLAEFLDAGPPPVYVGFGSMADPDTAAATTRQVLDALDRAGHRGVLATGWNGLERLDDLPDTVFVLDEAPHAWLFPRMAAVVHHGGAGTTAAGLRAGVPTVVVPHANDQFAWGRRVHELGAGPAPVRRKRLDADRLAAALARARSEPVVAAAAALGDRIRREDGAETAARVIADSLAQD